MAPAGFFADSVTISPSLAAAAGPLQGSCDDSVFFAAALQTVHRPFACTRNDGEGQPGTQHPDGLLVLPCAPAVQCQPSRSGACCGALSVLDTTNEPGVHGHRFLLVLLLMVLRRD